MDAFNPREFRNALGRFASGVTVITAHHEDHTHGMTANAFVSVSLDPPLVLVSLDNRSNMHRILPNAKRYGVSVLAEGQEALSNHFAGQSIPGVNFSFHMRQGIPLLEGAVAHFSVEVTDVHPAGDHTLYLGRVEHFEAHDRKPLLFLGALPLPATSPAKTIQLVCRRTLVILHWRLRSHRVNDWNMMEGAMHHINVPHLKRLLLLTALASLPAFAQIDLSGEWNPQFHEDQPERILGPEIGDYLGLPINTAARMRGRHLGCGNPDSAGAPVQTASRRLRPRGPRICASRRKWTRLRNRSSHGTRTSPGRRPSEQSIWMAVRIRPNTPSTPGRDFRRANGMAMF